MTESPNPNVIDTDTLTGDMHPIRRAVLAVGSNLGDRVFNLQGAVDALEDTPEVWLTGVSPVYETVPVDSPEGSENFLNIVVTIDTTLSAPTLLVRAEDSKLPDEEVKRMLALRPDVRFATIPGTTHDAHLDRPDAWRELLLDFLQSSRGERG